MLYDIRTVQELLGHADVSTTIQSDPIGSIIGQFKSISTKQINRIRNTNGIPAWQRDYFERVIRSESEPFRIREYIRNNPFQWADDEYNPDILKPFTQGWG